jgi:sugar lactone lactonase YvrE
MIKRSSVRSLIAVALFMIAIVVITSVVPTLVVHSSEVPIALPEENLKMISVMKKALYPEGIEYDPMQKHFLLSSVREGTIYTVQDDGTYQPFVQDERLISSLGIHIDQERNRLLVPNSDYGVSVHSKPGQQFKIAGLGIYNLSTGEPISYVDVGTLRPDSDHFANDVTVDAEGNSYLTDSRSPIIYKIDLQGNSSIFLENERFTGEGFNLNGIVYHPDGYLIVAKKNEGVLFKVPLDDPNAFTQIETSEPFIGVDGLVLAKDDTLIVIANVVPSVAANTIFQLQSSNGWQSAQAIDKYTTGDVYPSTGTIRDNGLYVIYGRLNTLPGTLEAPSPVFLDEFRIQQVAVIQESGEVKLRR